MRYLITIAFLILSACTTIKAPDNFIYKEIIKRDFDIVTWQKITSPYFAVKIYIEGDGHAFNSYGMPTTDPTPKSEMMRELAFGDNSPNVVYMGRVCQYKKTPICKEKFWTSARFAPEVLQAHYEAIKQIAQGREVILIGFSGGAQIAGLLATTTDLKIKKVITIAGNLDHKMWSDYHKLPSLNESLNLADYKEKFINVPQLHYIGEKDKVVPPILTYRMIENSSLIKMIRGADHNNGWNKIYDYIKKEN